MTQTIELSVTGMMCGGCEANISGKLTALDGVVSVTASSKAKQVTVEFDPAKTSLDTIKSTITGAGFTVES